MRELARSLTIDPQFESIVSRGFMPAYALTPLSKYRGLILTGDGKLLVANGKWEDYDWSKYFVPKFSPWEGVHRATNEDFVQDPRRRVHRQVFRAALKQVVDDLASAPQGQRIHQRIDVRMNPNSEVWPTP